MYKTPYILGYVYCIANGNDWKYLTMRNQVNLQHGSLYPYRDIEI